VPVRGSGRDDKDVGDNQEFREVEQRDFQALFVIDRRSRSESGFDGFRCRGNARSFRW
jgi:hypothetical protein